MNQKKAIELARQAGFSMENSAAIQAAERFAQLVRNVALAEPAVEPVAKHCMPHGWVINWPHPNGGTRTVYHPSSIQPKFGDMKPTMYPVYTSPPPPAQPVAKPYAWVVTGTGLFSIGPERPFDDDVWQPVYTSPPPPARPAVQHLPADDTEGGAL